MHTEWRTFYLDVTLIPLGLLINLIYHVWLRYKVRTQPSLTIFGIDADGRRFWIPAIIKDIEKKNIVAVQSVRNMMMGSIFMANTSILLCCSLGAVMSSTYRVKKPLIDSVYGAQGEFVVAVKYGIIFTTFLFSFLFHSLSVGFLTQLNILVCLPQHVISLVTPEHLSDLLRKASILNIVGDRLSHTGLFLLLWIFGPVIAFSCSVAMLLVFRKVDFVAGKQKMNSGIREGNNTEIIFKSSNEITPV